MGGAKLRKFGRRKNFRLEGYAVNLHVGPRFGSLKSYFWGGPKFYFWLKSKKINAYLNAWTWTPTGWEAWVAIDHF